jgi:hypothetical protein
MAPSGRMGRRMNEKYSHQKEINLIQYPVGSEENGCPVPNTNKTIINVTKEPRNSHKNTLKEKSCKKSLRKSRGRY